MSQRISSGNHLLFKTGPSGQTVRAGKSVDLTEELPNGIHVQPYYTIRVAGGNRVVSEGAVTFKIIMKIDGVSFLVLDSHTLWPGEQFNQTYNAPGSGVTIKVEAENGSGMDAVDVAVFGFKF